MSADVPSLIADPANEIIISPASHWEIAIKVSIGKYPLTVPFDRFFTEGIEGNDFEILPVGIRHAAVLASPPMHHRDPFDRMIVAQAIHEGIAVVSADRAFDSYPVTRLR